MNLDEYIISNDEETNEVLNFKRIIESEDALTFALKIGSKKLTEWVIRRGEREKLEISKIAELIISDMEESIEILKLLTKNRVLVEFGDRGEQIKDIVNQKVNQIKSNMNGQKKENKEYFGIRKGKIKGISMISKDEISKEENELDDASSCGSMVNDDFMNSTMHFKNSSFKMSRKKIVPQEYIQKINKMDTFRIK